LRVTLLRVTSLRVTSLRVTLLRVTLLRVSAGGVILEPSFYFDAILKPR